MMIKNKYKVSKSKMIDYYFDLLKYKINPIHRKYIVHQIGFYCGELKRPPLELSERLK